MKIILATSNKGKIRELKEALQGYEVMPYSELIESFEIEENGKSFKENAIIKAKAIYEKLEGYEDIAVLSDDSGISVPIFGNEPGVKSARYAGEKASAKDNLNKLIKELKKRGVKKTPAFYTASIAVVSKDGVSTVHGWMYGEVIDEAKGDKGFGYDPIFIPNGFDKTLGELDESVKKELSHRSRAIKRVKMIL